jgi:hypothetical protein
MKKSEFDLAPEGMWLRTEFEAHLLGLIGSSLGRKLRFGV